jgi:hypothetical protein
VNGKKIGRLWDSFKLPGLAGSKIEDAYGGRLFGEETIARKEDGGLENFFGTEAVFVPEGFPIVGRQLIAGLIKIRAASLRDA